MVRHAARLLPEKTTARRVVGGRAGAWVRQGRAYSRTSAIHRTASSAAGAPRHAPRGRRAVCIGTSPGIVALRWLGCLRPTGGAGGAQYSARPAPRQAAAAAAAGAPQRLSICAPGKNMYQRSGAMFPPPEAAERPRKSLHGEARRENAGRGASVDEGPRPAALTRLARGSPPGSFIRFTRSVKRYPGRGGSGSGGSAGPSYPYDAVRRETAGQFRLAPSGEVRPGAVSGARRARAGDRQQYRRAPERPAPALRNQPFKGRRRASRSSRRCFPASYRRFSSSVSGSTCGTRVGRPSSSRATKVA